MRKVLISLAAAGTALAFATPASAQYYPQPQPYGYGQGYGYGYGHGGNFHQVRALQARIDQIQYRIENLRARRLITRDEANGLRSESRGLERRLRRAASYGLNYNEARRIEFGIVRLEQHVRREVRDGRGWGNRGYGYQGGYDRDRDGRDDRYENDRGWERDD